MHLLPITNAGIVIGADSGTVYREKSGSRVRPIENTLVSTDIKVELKLVTEVAQMQDARTYNVGSVIARSYVHYPIVTPIVHILSLGSLILLLADFISRRAIVNPYALIGVLVAAVALSAAVATLSREIDEAANA